MAFTRPELETIYSRMKSDTEARITGQAAIPRFSLLGVILYVFAAAIYLVYGFLVFLAEQLFPDTATVEYLDRLAIMYNLPRKSAEFAEGTIQFSGTPGTVIPAGTLLQDDNGQEYATVSEVTVAGDGTVNADIQAQEAGAQGNTTDSTLDLVSPLAGVDTEANIITALNGGQDRETDESLRARILQRLRNAPASGNAADYRRWARSVEGVSKVWVLDAVAYNGPGTVGVIVATGTLDPVDPAVKTDTEAYIETQRPLGANVDVLDPNNVIIDFIINITPNTLDIRTGVTDRLNSYLLANSEPGGLLRISEIRDTIYSAGMTDYIIIDITKDGASQPVENLQMSGIELAQLGTITFNELV